MVTGKTYRKLSRLASEPSMLIPDDLTLSLILLTNVVIFYYKRLISILRKVAMILINLIVTFAPLQAKDKYCRLYPS